jgi:hypothetical protein
MSGNLTLQQYVITLVTTNLKVFQTMGIFEGHLQIEMSYMLEARTRIQPGNICYCSFTKQSLHPLSRAPKNKI